MRIEFHPEAWVELRSAAIWYENRQPGLGEEFLKEVAATIERIGEASDSFPAWTARNPEDPPIRRANLVRFPYVIAFEKR